MWLLQAKASFDQAGSKHRRRLDPTTTGDWESKVLGSGNYSGVLPHDQVEGKASKKGSQVQGEKPTLWSGGEGDGSGDDSADKKRKLPKAEEPAVFSTDVFIPLNETMQKLEGLLQGERVVFLRSGVATGKSTLAKYICQTQPSKYLAVHAPVPADATKFEEWEAKMRAAVGRHKSDVEAMDDKSMTKSKSWFLMNATCYSLAPRFTSSS